MNRAYGRDRSLRVVVYDVSDDRRRGKIFRLLSAYGEHVQKSAFECYIDRPGTLKLMDKLKKLIDDKCDSLTIYSASPDNSLALGRAKITRLEEVIIF